MLAVPYGRGRAVQLSQSNQQTADDVLAVPNWWGRAIQLSLGRAPQRASPILQSPSCRERLVNLPRLGSRLFPASLAFAFLGFGNHSLDDCALGIGQGLVMSRAGNGCPDLRDGGDELIAALLYMDVLYCVDHRILSLKRILPKKSPKV